MPRLLNIFVEDVNRDPVNHPAQRIELTSLPCGEHDLVTGQSAAQFVLTACMQDSGFELLVATPDFWDFRATFAKRKTPSSGVSFGLVKRSGGLADISADETNPFKIKITVILSMLFDVSHNGSKIKQPPQDGRYIPKEEYPDGTVITNLDIPQHPIISSDGNAEGKKRLNLTLRPFQDIVPKGRVYIAERKGERSPRLVMIWRPDYLTFSPGDLTGIGYHLYFHPTIGAFGAKWGDYPFGDGYVGLGYRSLIWEYLSVYQHFQTRKKVIFVVPVGSQKEQFGEITSQSGVYRFLKEVNLFVQQQENVDFHYWQKHNIERVALSGFSAGGLYLTDAMTKPGTSSSTGSALAKEFYDSKLREIYTFDCVGGPSFYLDQIVKWWRADGDQRFRIYAERDDGAKSRMIRQFKAAVSPAPFPNTAEVHYKDLGSLVILPGGFFYRPPEWPDKRGVPIPKDKDPHHWFPRFFISHAIGNSSFSA